MKAITMSLVAILILGIAVPGMCNWEITFGKEVAQVGFVNPPAGPEDFPLGPNSFKLIDGKLWLADSVKGRILSFSVENKLETTISVPGLAKQFYLDDFAVQISNGKVVAVWVAERFANELVKVSPDGKELVRVKATSLAQIDELTVDSKGQLYVGDFGKSQLAVYSSEGKFLRKMPWQLSGFVTDSSDNLHMINYVEGKGHQHLTIDPSGKELSRTEIGFAQMQNPRIWHVTSKNEILVSFIPKSGDPTKNILVNISDKGTILKKMSFTNPYYISKYLLIGEETCWLVKADYLKSPEKAIIISELGTIR